MFSKITSRISKPLSVFDKLGFASWLILGDEFLFLNLFFIFRFFFVILCYLLIINFYKNFCYYYHFINFFFMKIYFIFSCSGMFRNVPCSGFYRFIVYFVRLKRQTSQLHTIFMQKFSYVFTQYFASSVHVRFYFSLPLIFTSLAASISHFLTAALNFHVFLPTNFQ